MPLNKSVSHDCNSTALLLTSKHQDDALDEALIESFPASDPIALNFTCTSFVVICQEQQSLASDLAKQVSSRETPS
jgi:hypothetical protein